MLTPRNARKIVMDARKSGVEIRTLMTARERNWTVEEANRQVCAFDSVVRRIAESDEPFVKAKVVEPSADYQRGWEAGHANAMEAIRAYEERQDSERRERREALAGLAMAGLLASGEWDPYAADTVAAKAVGYSDALIEQLERTGR